jgi:hypothetical protein
MCKGNTMEGSRVPVNDESPSQRRESQSTTRVPVNDESPSQRRESQSTTRVPVNDESPSQRRESQSMTRVPVNDESPSQLRGFQLQGIPHLTCILVINELLFFSLNLRTNKLAYYRIDHRGLSSGLLKIKK